MRAFENTLVAIAAVATLGAATLAATQASACDYDYGYDSYSYGNSYPSYYAYSQPVYSLPSYDYSSNSYPSYGYYGQPQYILPSYGDSYYASW